MTDRVEWEQTNCPLCDCGESRVWRIARDLLSGFPDPFTLVMCQECRHIFMNPRPTRATIGLCYPANYGPFRESSSVAESHTACCSEKQPVAKTSSPASWIRPRSWSWLRRLVAWWIDSRATCIPPVSVNSPRGLELGCARGDFLLELSRAGWQTVGIEPAAEVAQRAAAKGLDVRAGTLADSLRPDETFDAIFAWMVVEHLHDPVATLRLARQRLKPGGWLLFSVPNVGCWEPRWFGRYCYSLADVTHLQHFTPASIRQLLKQSDLELVNLIHQRNTNNVVGSLGMFLRTRWPTWSAGDWLLRWVDSPGALGLISLSFLARFLAAIHQSGRLTIIARRNDST